MMFGRGFDAPRSTRRLRYMEYRVTVNHSLRQRWFDSTQAHRAMEDCQNGIGARC